MAREPRGPWGDNADRRPEVLALYENMKGALPDLEQAIVRMQDHWCYEDGVYRFYHQSYKVYYLQDEIRKTVALLESLAPGKPLNEWFLKIVGDGTAREFDPSANDRWLEATRPIVEAFFHCKFMVEMIVKYVKEFGAEEAPPNLLPSGWAAVLYLYGLR